jgi:hypothetical protein
MDRNVFHTAPDGSVNFGGPQPYPAEVTFYPYEHMQVVQGGVGGHPEPVHPSGRVARFDLTAADISAGRYHSKVYKYFEISQGISGTYRAHLWLPTDFSITQGAGLLVNVFQFKDGEGMNGGASTPRFELGLQPAWFTGVSHPSGRADAPVAIIRHDKDWNNPKNEGGSVDWHGPQTPRAVPLGQPVEFRADVYERDRVDFYLDGQFVGSVAHSHRSFGGTGSYSRSLIWGLGHYSSDPGYLYVLDADYTKR